MGSREPEIDPSSDVAFNEDSILCRNQQKIVGKKVSFEIDRDVVEGLAHRTELALRQTTEENEVTAESKSEKGPYVELEDKAE